VKSSSGGPIVLAGATGDLGGRIAAALGRRRVAFRVLTRPGRPAALLPGLAAVGATVVEVDYDDATALRNACDGASCVVSALNGLEPVMLGMQGKLLDAAVAAGVPRFIPSDYSLDFTKTRPGENRNLDLRRRFMERIDGLPIKATSVLNGAFADLLAGAAPIVLSEQRKILYWGSADQPLDFTNKDDVAVRRGGRPRRRGTPLPAHRRLDGEPTPAGRPHDRNHGETIRTLASRWNRAVEHAHSDRARAHAAKRRRLPGMARHAVSPRHGQRSWQARATRQ